MEPLTCGLLAILGASLLNLADSVYRFTPRLEGWLRRRLEEML